METKEYLWKLGMDHTHWPSQLTERFNSSVAAISMGEPEPDISSDASDQVTNLQVKYYRKCSKQTEI